jgi:anti-anti-sigma factor
LSWEVSENTAEVEVSGDLDMAAAFKLEPEIDRLVAERDVEDLVLDLGGVSFIDSAGLGSLLSTHERLSDLGIASRVVAMSDPVARVLDTTGTRDRLIG